MIRVDRKSGYIEALPSTTKHPKPFAKRFLHRFDAVYESCMTSKDVFTQIQPTVSQMLSGGPNVSVFVTGHGEDTQHMYKQLTSNLLANVLMHLSLLQQTFLNQNQTQLGKTNNRGEASSTNSSSINIQLLIFCQGELYDLLGNHQHALNMSGTGTGTGQGGGRGYRSSSRSNSNLSFSSLSKTGASAGHRGQPKSLPVTSMKDLR